MVHFDTFKQEIICLFESLERIFNKFQVIPKTLKIGIVAALLLCCFSSPSLFAQCNPDVSPPTAVCVGPYTIALDGSGQAGIDPDDIDNGSFDGCGAVTLAVSPNLVTCADIGIVAITLTVTDLAGNMNFCSTNVTVEDNLPPVLTCPADVTVSCSLPSTGPPTAVDNCDLFPMISSPSDVTISATGANCFTVERTWTAEDNNMNVGSCTQVITVQDGNNPVFTSAPIPSPLNVECSSFPPAMPPMQTATDGCTTPSINFSTIDGQDPDPSVCGHYDFTFIRIWDAVDNCGNITSRSQVINVSDNTVPTFPGAPILVNIPASASCLTPVILVVTADDNCANGSLTTTYTVFDIGGMIVDQGNGLDASGNYLPGIYSVLFSATDPCQNEGTHTVTLNVVDNIAPTAICNAVLITVSIPPTGTATLVPSQIDNGSNDNCTLQADLILSLSPNTFDCGDIGGIPETVVLTVTDANGNSATCNSLIDVVDNSPPAMFCQNITRNLNADGYVTVGAMEIDAGSFDACGIDTFEISKDGGNTYGPTTTFFCPETGDNNVILRVTDDAGNMNTCPAVVKVIDNISPDASSACSNETVYLDQSGMFMLDFLQIDSTKTNSADSTISTGVDTTISEITFYGTGVIKDVNVLNMLIVHDRIGDLNITLTSPTGTVVTLGDQPGVPVSMLGCEEADISASFDDLASSPAEAFENSCDTPSPAISGTFQPINPLSAFNGEDVNGVWTLTVTDTTSAAPATMGFIDSWSLQIDYQRWDNTLIGYGADDNCCASIGDLSQTMFTCDDIDTNPNVGGNQPRVYTLTVTDPSGNTDQCTGTITVMDTLRPMLTCVDTIAVCLDADGLGKIFPDSLINGGIYISSGDNGSGNSGDNEFCVTVSNAITFSFDWNYQSNNSSPTWDPFGFTIGGGAFQQLTTNITPLMQSGTATVTLNAGQEFCFVARTTDNLGGNAEVWIKNFSETFTGDFGQPKWSSSFTNSDGKAFFVDASVMCDPLDYQITLDSVTWQNCDSLFCDSLDAYVNAWVRAVDHHGKVSDTCLVKLHVEDKQPPLAACDDVIVALNGNGEATVNAIAFDDGSIDNCDPGPLDFMIATAGINGPYSASILFDCGDLATGPPIPIFFKATDNFGNEGFCLTSLELQDNLPPVISCPPTASIACELAGNSPPATITGFATAVDNCDGSVLTSIFNENPTPNGADCLTFTRTWAATDTEGNTSLCAQTITITDTTNPILSGVPNYPNPFQCNPPTAPTVTASDNCDTNVSLSSTFNDSRFNNSTNPPTPLFLPSQCGYYNYTVTRTWTATDNCSNSTTASRTAIIQDTQDPVFNYTSIVTVGNTPGQCLGFATIDVTNAITDCADFQYLTITYEIDGNMVIHNGPVASGNFNVGVHTVEFTATDPCGNSSTHTVTVTILDNETPTAICQPGPIPLTLNSNGIATITPSTINNGSNDNCFVASLNVSPALFDCFTTPNPHTVTLTVTDAAGNSNTCTTEVIITNASTPAIVCPLDITVLCQNFDENNPATSGGSATATTACGPVTTTYTDVTVSGLGDCRVINRTWDATTAGGTATCLQVITVEDNSNPSLFGVPADVTVDCNSIPIQATPTSTDNCDLSPTIGFSEMDTQNGDPSNCLHYNYSITRTWTATDDCGNSTMDSRVITVLDDDNPLVSIPNPLIIGTDPDECFATVNVNLLDFITDCAADAFLAITNSALASYGFGNGTDDINGVYVPGDYPITGTVTDPCGNSTPISFILSIRDLEAPQAVCLPATTLILDGNGTGSLVPGDIDNGSTDNCGAVTLSISPNTFDINDVGIVNVELTVTDGSGNTSMCTTPVTVIERGTVSADDVTGGSGTTVSIPVTVTGFDDICAVSFSIHVDDPAVATVTGVSGFGLPGMSVSDFFPNSPFTNDIAFSWVSGAPVTIPDGTTIFNVDVLLVGGIGTSTTVTIDGTPIAEMFVRCDLSTVPVTTLNGSVSIVATPMNVLLDGSLETENGDPVELANVAMTGSVGDNQTTGTPPGTATYAFSVPLGSNETITPTKDINDCNGINVLDVLVLQLHILGDPMNQIPTPYRRIAADINNDGSINVLDRLELHLIVLAGIPCIGLSNSTSWRFVDASYVFPDPLNPFSPPFPQSIVYTGLAGPMTGDFIGMKIGDLTLDADPASIVGDDDDVSDGGNGLLQFSIDDQTVAAGQEYRVDIKAKDFVEMSAFQNTFGFNPDVLKLKDIELGALPGMSEQHFGLNGIDDGQITSIWYNDTPTTLQDNEVLFTLVFDAIDGGAKLSSLLNIVSAPVVANAWNSNLDKFDLGLTFNNVTGINEAESDAFALYQNRPNPFGSATIIPFYLQNATSATLTIIDVSGKIVKVYEGNYTAGYQEVRVASDDLPTSGVFFYTLETAEGIAVRKMVLLD